VRRSRKKHRNPPDVSGNRSPFPAPRRRLAVASSTLSAANPPTQLGLDGQQAIQDRYHARAMAQQTLELYHQLA